LLTGEPLRLRAQRHKTFLCDQSGRKQKQQAGEHPCSRGAFSNQKVRQPRRKSHETIVTCPRGDRTPTDSSGRLVEQFGPALKNPGSGAVPEAEPAWRAATIHGPLRRQATGPHQRHGLFAVRIDPGQANAGRGRQAFFFVPVTSRRAKPGAHGCAGFGTVIIQTVTAWQGRAGNQPWPYEAPRHQRQPKGTGKHGILP